MEQLKQKHKPLLYIAFCLSAFSLLFGLVGYISEEWFHEKWEFQLSEKVNISIKVNVGLWIVCPVDHHGYLYIIQEFGDESMWKDCYTRYFQPSLLALPEEDKKWKYLTQLDIMDLIVNLLLLLGLLLMFVAQWVQIVGWWPAAPCYPVRKKHLVLKMAVLLCLSGLLIWAGALVFSINKHINPKAHADSNVGGYGYSYALIWVSVLMCFLSVALYGRLYCVVGELNDLDVPGVQSNSLRFGIARHTRLESYTAELETVGNHAAGTHSSA